MFTRRLRHIRPTLLACALVALPLLVAGAVWEGLPGMLGAAAGVSLTIIGFSASWFFVVWTEQLSLKLILPAGLMGYVAKIMLFSAAFMVAKRTEWQGMMPMAAAAIVSIVAVLVALMIWGSKARIPYVQPVDDPA